MTQNIKGAGRSRYAANKARHDQRTPFLPPRDVLDEHTQALLDAARRGLHPDQLIVDEEVEWDG